MSKKIIIIIISVLVLAVIGFVFYKNGYITFMAYGDNNGITYAVKSVNELKNNSYYVWHDESVKSINHDLETDSDKEVFFLCPSGSKNWNKDSFIKHIIWFTSDNDVFIPTIYPGDKLLYICRDKIPYEGIKWERFADYGYSIGVANLEGDMSSHYYIISDGDSFKGYVYKDSDANDLNQFATVGNLFLDKVGGIPVRENVISEGGTILKLNKDQEYICEWYTGTYYQDFKMKANIHVFSYIEEFTTYDYDFLHSNVIEITIPEWFKTGYYYIANVGMLRYLSPEDANLYNNEPYDKNIDWNDPIILYNENRAVIYDPSQNIDRRYDDNFME